MHRWRTVALVAGAAVAIAACSGPIDVTSERADPIATVVPTTTAPPATTVPPAPDPPSTTTPIVPLDPSLVNREAIDFGPNKTPRAYDDFLLAVITDLEAWWTQEYPALYDAPFDPLSGSIYAAYPGRPDDIPGCGTDRTTYDEVQQYVAFYCGEGDFMVYDDGDDGLLEQLARDYGAATIGTVFAHEFAHAIQLRFGGLDRRLPTIVTEQQADCFAGAWTARVANGQSPTVQFSDGDVRAGLIAMTKVSDPVGLDQFVDGGHGSAFDRVGAFQVGYLGGAERCSQLLDAPLPLVPNEFTSTDEVTTGGDARFGYGAEDLMGFLPSDLNKYWNEEMASKVPGVAPLTITVVSSPDDVRCDDLRGDLSQGSALCASTNEVFFNEPVARDLYNQLGDFSVGYLLGTAWSEAVQDALGSTLTGEPRALLGDCLTGGWVKSDIPIDYALPEPRLATRTVTVSAGDLDEAIQTVLLVADMGVNDNIVGNAFEKIESFRTGVLGGTDACLAQL